MAERAGAAVDVDLVLREGKIAHRRHSDDGEGLVDLEEIDDVRAPAAILSNSRRIAPIGAVGKFFGSVA